MTEDGTVTTKQRPVTVLGVVDTAAVNGWARQALIGPLTSGVEGCVGNRTRRLGHHENDSDHYGLRVEALAGGNAMTKATTTTS